MQIALTGVSGFIGSVIARHLHEAGHDVIGLVRETSRRDHVAGIVKRFVVGDQDDEAVWPELLDGAGAVVHNSIDWPAIRDGDVDRHLSSNLLGSIRLLHASRPRPFVYMSSIAVHHDMRPRWDGVIDEDHPLRPGSLYGACKAAVEAHLWPEHFGDGRHVAAIRPCAVYGLDPCIERSIGWPFIEQIRSGEAFARPGGGKFVHVDDVAAVVTAAITRPEAAGQAINLADCYARWSDLAMMVREILGAGTRIDETSPAQPKNVFTKDAARRLGVTIDRGHAGLRAHLEALCALAPAAG